MFYITCAVDSFVLFFSPLVSAGGNLPRGIVTATTVPKGSTFTSSSLPNTSKQAKPNQTHTKSAVESLPKVPATNATPVLSSTNKHTSPVISNSTHSTRTSLSNSDKTAVDSSPPLLHTSSSENTDLINETVASSVSSSLPASANPTSVALSSHRSQLVDAHSLLQQQGAGTDNSSVTNSAVPLISQLSPELLAQVSSFLNVPGQTSSSPAVSESVSTCKESNVSEDTIQGRAFPLYILSWCVKQHEVYILFSD